METSGHDLPWSADIFGGVHRSEIDNNWQSNIGGFDSPEDATLAIHCVNTHAGLIDALALLLAKADQLIFRPAVDDGRQIDQHTRELRAVLEPARRALAAARA